MNKRNPRLTRARRSFIILAILLAGLIASTAVMARGGQAADDCPAGSKDPDCK